MEVSETNTLITEQDDFDRYKLLITYKNNLMNYIGIDNFINKVREIVDESESFDFRSNKSRKFINKERPIFILKVNDDLNKKFLGQNFRDEKVANDITSEVTDLLKKEITDKLSEFIMENINSDESLKKYFNEFDETLRNLCVSNIYGIRNSILDNMIYLEYFR